MIFDGEGDNVPIQQGGEGSASTSVMGVRGELRADELGIVLPHEHIQIDLFRGNRDPDGYLKFDVPLAIEDVLEFRRLGGRTIVDVTSRGLSREPNTLVLVAEQTNTNIVMGCGHYRHPFLDQRLESMTTEAIAEDIVEEIEQGVGDTGIRPGVIGECGAEKEYVTPLEERALRAAARAQVKTGLPFSVHATRSEVGWDCLTILEEEGADLSRTVVSHCDHYANSEFHTRLAKRGAFVEFDRHSPRYPWEQNRRVGLIRQLADAGFVEHILLSHDICHKSERRTYGGPGYSYVLEEVVPMLKAVGFSDQEIEQILIHNPRRWLCGG